jgi:hypothetical protein
VGRQRRGGNGQGALGNRGEPLDVPWWGVEWPERLVGDEAGRGGG